MSHEGAFPENLTQRSPRSLLRRQWDAERRHSCVPLSPCSLGVSLGLRGQQGASGARAAPRQPRVLPPCARRQHRTRAAESPPPQPPPRVTATQRDGGPSAACRHPRLPGRPPPPARAPGPGRGLRRDGRRRSRAPGSAGPHSLRLSPLLREDLCPVNVTSLFSEGRVSFSS